MSALEGASNFNFNGNHSKKFSKQNGFSDSRRGGGANGKKRGPNRQASGGNSSRNDGTMSESSNNKQQDKNSNMDRKRSNFKKGFKHKEGFNKPSSNQIPTFKTGGETEETRPPVNGFKSANVQAYSHTDVTSAGTLFDSPEALGFQKNSIPKAQRVRPKYMSNQTRILEPVPFVQDSFDKQNQEKMLEMERQGQGKDYQGLYEVFQKMREAERKQMESLGLVDAENVSKDLDDAIVFRGSCLDMCPIFERVRRALENNVKSFEKDPVTDKISRERAVKAFSRPAAGQPPPLPSEVRPPHILKQTLDYLVNNIANQLPAAHSFLWDRTRSIRQDFTYQNYSGPEAIDCNERIVRLHLLTLHIMAGSDMEYSQQQELEQFNKALQTLVEIYQDVRNHGGRAPNEAEFRAYHLLSHIMDPELEREIQNVPDDVFQDSKIQLALRLRNMASQNNIIERGHNNTVGALNLFSDFFKMVFSDEVPVLFACLLETHFNEVRFHALKSMARCYHTKGKAYSAEALRDILGFDSLQGVTNFVAHYEIDIIQTDDETLIDLFNKEKLETKYKLNSYHDKSKLPPPCSQKIDVKLNGHDLKYIINSGKNNDQLNLKQQKDIQTLRQKLLSKHKGKGNLEVTSEKSQTTFGGFKNDANIGNKMEILTKQPQPAVFGNSTAGLNSMESDKNDVRLPVAETESQSSQASSAFTFTQKVNKAELSKPESSFNFGQSSTATGGLAFPLKQSSNQSPQQGLFLSNSDLTSKTSKTSVFNNGNSQPPEGSNNLTPVPNVSAFASGGPKLDLDKPPRRKLVDSQYFPEAMAEVVKELSNSLVTTELIELLPKLIKHQRAVQERESLIGIISDDLFKAFTSELTYFVTLKSKADHVYKSNLKTNIVKKIKNFASELASKHKDRQKKLNELHLIAFQAPSKRVLSNSSTPSNSSSPKKRHQSRKSLETDREIYQRQEEVRKLWEPIDLKSFVNQCTNNFNVKNDSKDVELKFLLIVEDWSRSFSKWLNTKLALKVNQTNATYENTVRAGKMSLNLSSLPNNNYSSKDYFANTSFMLFECGIFEEYTSEDNSKEKLKRDERILKKIIDLASRYSYYNVQIIVLYWDMSRSALNSEEVFQLLKLKEHLNNEIVSDIVLCDMSKQDANVNESLVNAFNIVSKNFRGELTPRGSKKKRKIELSKRDEARRLSEENRRVVSNNMFAQEEKESLERARLTRKYSYLANHMSQSNISQASNFSGNSTFFVTANHRTNTSSVSQNENQFSDLINLRTTLGDNTTMNNATANNASILTGFGNGVLEQSTPFGSPKAKSFARPSSKNIPRSLDQLRELTASVRARYPKRPS